MDLPPGQTATPSASTPTGTTAEDRSTAFRPVQGGAELQSGEKLLVEAYAAIWIILFVLVLLSWRRQRRLDERVTSLSTAIDRARQEESAKGDG